MKSRWLLRFPPRPEARVRLLCLPGAGAAAAMYRSWSELLPADLEVCAVQLPGRGARLREALYTAMDPLVDALTEAVLAEPALPTVVFGHSLGSLVGFELASRLTDSATHAPSALVVAAHRAPRLGSAGLPYHRLADADLAKVMVGLGGTPEEVLARPELLRLALPSIRADFELDYTYRYRERPALPIPIRVFGGLGDTTVAEPELAAWREHTSAGFSLRMLPGDHFFPTGASGVDLLAQLGELASDLLQHA
ncbi:medium-chain acyl-[acyl-carrier-protein] hydrolase [Kitasatospora sp. GAS204A]|uniref:thioesterase II family protein n=1 Tax=unclassified Kitasatospora TaxID=2633591 RepID=UPI00247543DB|nr:alpha/beta fold hydrolase [Kitasatospora sp. GAS204B]MDH6117666.1 medium-chain acyl-[acyl-carrier-protein] hydrolase [Kitasatospora sp. GAS204B]